MLKSKKQRLSRGRKKDENEEKQQSSDQDIPGHTSASPDPGSKKKVAVHEFPE